MNLDTASQSPGALTADQHPMFLAGKWVWKEKNMEIRNPENQALIGLVPLADRQDAELALVAAVSAKTAARNLPTHERASILARVAGLVQRDFELFAQTIATEGIKTISEARQEVTRCLYTLRLAAEESSRCVGETIQFGQQPGSESRLGHVLREPVGVIVAITPFNDPLNLVAHKIAPAIAAGNVVVLKPHEATPLSALRLARIFQEAGLPDGILQVLTGRGADIGTTLVADERVRMVSFTGGRRTGALIARLAGVKKLAFELGSNCPTIVMDDADILNAVRACVSGAFWAAGQNCLHVQRMYVHRDIFDTFRDEFIGMTESYRLGRKLDDATDMGCLIDEGAASRIERTLLSARETGARILVGGSRRGTAFDPTLVTGVPDNHELMQEEIYGPVSVLASFDSFNEAIARANSTDYGLQAAIFTRDLEIALAAIDRLEAGAVMINDTTDYRLDAMPFGGIKGSGIGREGVRSAMEEMTEPKVVCLNRSSMHV